MTKPQHRDQPQHLERILDSLGVALEPHGGRLIEYQAMLRVIGAILDELKARDVAVIECFNSFSLRFISGSEIDVRDLTYDELLDAYQTLRKDRRLLGSAEQGYYQDLLRAIGFELERVRGRNLLLAEAGENYLLTFQTAESNTFFVRKHTALLTSDVVDQILAQARSRRATSMTWSIRTPKRAPKKRTDRPDAILDQFRDPDASRRMLAGALAPKAT